MLVISNRMMRTLTTAVMVCALSLVVAGWALWTSHEANKKRDAYAAENRSLIVQLQQSQDALTEANARDQRNVALALQRQSALLRLVLGLQGQVRGLGATPLPLPSSLRSDPAFEGPTPSPTPGSIATPSPSPQPRPTAVTPRPVPSPTPSPSPCIVHVGPVSVC